MELDPTLSSFVPLVARASVAFGTDFRYAEAMAKQAGVFAKTEATDARATPAAA